MSELRSVTGKGDLVPGTLRIQEHYLRAFSQLKAGEFYPAWFELEQTEIALHNLERHDTGFWKEFHLDFIKEYTAKWQSLFPYKMFFSSEFLQAEKICSVCGQRVVPHAFCGHRVGEIYNGEMCYRTITKIEAGGISFVDNPVQKYSVVFLDKAETGEQQDRYNYSLVQFAIGALRGPFAAWAVERTTRRQPHARFADVGPNDPCPCGSGNKYQGCCLLEPGVLRPHFEFLFDERPPADVPLAE